jgi:hypothetical protein
VLGAGVSTSLRDLVIADADNDALTVSLSAASGSFTAPANLPTTAGVSYAVNTQGVVTLSGPADAVAAAIKSMNYVGASSGASSITISATDTSNVTTSAVVYLKVPNTAPSITLPEVTSHAQALNSFAISGLAVSDPDRSDSLSVTVNAGTGAVLKLSSTGGATYAKLSDGKFVLQGTAEQVDAALATLSVTPSQTGAIDIQISVTDGIATSATTSTLSLFANAKAPTAVSVPGMVGPSGLSSHSLPRGHRSQNR